LAQQLPPAFGATMDVLLKRFQRNIHRDANISFYND